MPSLTRLNGHSQLYIRLCLYLLYKYYSTEEVNFEALKVEVDLPNMKLKCKEW